MSRFRDRPRSLAEPEPFLTREECEELGQRVIAMATGGGETVCEIVTETRGQLRWSRNRTALASAIRVNNIFIRRHIGGPGGGVYTNQMDDETLRAAVRAAERLARSETSRPPDKPEVQVPHEYPTTAIWSDASYRQTTDDRARAVAPLMSAAESAGLFSAGYAATVARSYAVVGSDTPTMYARQTIAECSTTVRDQRGTGSGWAGASSYDVAQFQPSALGQIAQQKCLASRNPVSIEPGRYTLIMEPQAVYDFVRVIPTGWPPPDRTFVEGSNAVSPFFDRVDPATGLALSKLGQKILDERISISHDPTDPQLGMIPFRYDPNTGESEPYRPITWVDRGVLTQLPYDRVYALNALGEYEGRLPRAAFRMSGGTSSIEEMIRTTKRGLLVTRFWDIRQLDQRTLLSTGLTRDGLWLIENGAISHPVKNLRFTESPLFSLNSVDELGVPQPVFSPGAPAVVPAIKVHDFSFTSLVDAI